MINQVSETNYLSLSVHLAKMLFHGINENTSFVFARFTVIPRFCFVEKRFSYRFRTFPTRAGAVIKKKNGLCPLGRSYHHFGENSSVDDRACDICYLLACFVYTREVGKSFKHAL